MVSLIYFFILESPQWWWLFSWALIIFLSLLINLALPGVILPRFYKLEELTIFLDDQGRDVLKAAQIIKEKNLPFIGPMASIGNVYLGPLYYWAITPVLWLFGFNPVGPVVLVALLGVLTNIFAFFFLWRYFDKKALSWLVFFTLFRL